MIEEWDGPTGAIVERILATQNCRALFEIWRDARPDRSAIPRKSAIDPVILAGAGLLPRVWLVERDGDGFRYRLVSEHLRPLYMQSLLGRRLEEVHDGEALSALSTLYRRTVADEGVHFSVGPVFSGDTHAYDAVRILLPLADDDGQSRYAIGTTDETDVRRFVRVESNPRFEFDFLAWVSSESLRATALDDSNARR